MAKDKETLEGLFTGQDAKGNDVTVYIKKPTVSEYRDSQIGYNKAFRAALDSGAVLKKKLNQFMRDQGLWDDQKDKEEQAFLDKIRGLEGQIKKGGIPLKEARRVALDLREARDGFRLLIAERTALDANTVEGQADNARFNSLVCLCILKQDQSGPFFATEEEYDKRGAEPFVVAAAARLASLIYELDPNYDDSLVENKFLTTYNFANEKNQLINSDGHLIDIDDDGVERLINEEGRFVAYHTDEGYKNQDPDDTYYVNRDGEEITEDGDVKDGFSPFLDEDGNPVDVPEPVKAENEDSEEPESEESEAEASEKPKRRGRPKKTEEIT